MNSAPFIDRTAYRSPISVPFLASSLGHQKLSVFLSLSSFFFLPSLIELFASVGLLTDIFFHGGSGLGELPVTKKSATCWFHYQTEAAIDIVRICKSLFFFVKRLMLTFFLLLKSRLFVFLRFVPVILSSKGYRNFRS